LLHGHYSASSLLQTRPNPSRLPPTSRGSPVIRLPCSADFSSGRGGFLQLLSMTLSPCCPYQPAEVFRRISPCDAPCCLRPKSEGSAFGLQYFRGHMGSLALRPGSSLTILFRWLRQASGCSVSFLPAIQATGLGLLPRWDFHPLFMPAFAGRTLRLTTLIAVPAPQGMNLL
jgi:hypothetical protein